MIDHTNLGPLGTGNIKRSGALFSRRRRVSSGTRETNRSSRHNRSSQRGRPSRRLSRHSIDDDAWLLTFQCSTLLMAMIWTSRLSLVGGKNRDIVATRQGVGGARLSRTGCSVLQQRYP